MIAPVSRHEWLDLESHRPLVVACAKRFLRQQTSCAMTLDDLMQEAWMALYDASPHLWRVPANERNAYLSRSVLNAFVRLAKKHRPMHTGVTDCVASDDDEPADQLPLDRLSAAQRKLLKAHLGLNGATPQTLKSLAAKWGVSRSTLSRRLASCRDCIRNLDH